MASLPLEEENYVRMSLLLTGISPRAVRTCFDNEFAPACLDASLKKEYNKLLDLKKQHIINQPQWNLLFPRFPDVPDSKTFDTTLMTTLLRNLTPMTPPLYGFDRLPSTIDTTPAADLARIKHYRNYLAHLDDGKIDITLFNTAWADITIAIERLGGQQMKQECVNMKTKPLDQTNQEIIKDIKYAHNEILGLKESIESLKRSYDEMVQSHEVVTKEMKEIKFSQQDSVPWNIRAQHNQDIKDWENDESTFLKTRSTYHILKSIPSNDCIIVTGSSGCGKSSNIHHAALQLRDWWEYEIIPVITGPTDIIKYYNESKKQVFVVDDICGKESINIQTLQLWRDNSERLEKIFKTIENETTCNSTVSQISGSKLLISCRLQIYKEEQFQLVKLLTRKECNVLSPEMCLLQEEKKIMLKKYIPKAIIDDVMKVEENVDFFPLLCKLAKGKASKEVIKLFSTPVDSITENLKHIVLEKKELFCALALCILFDDEFNTDWLKLKSLLDQEKKDQLADIVKEFEIDLSKEMSRNTLKSRFITLESTYLKKFGNEYRFIHNKIHEMAAVICGQRLPECFIKYAPPEFIRDKFIFKSVIERPERDDVIFLSIDAEEEYFERLLSDLKKFIIVSTFHNTQLEYQPFRAKLISFFRKSEEALEILKKLETRNRVEKKGLISIGWLMPCTLTTPLLESASCGYLDLFQFLVDTVKCNVNVTDVSNRSPLHKAAEGGKIDVVKFLCENNATVSQCNMYGQSPLYVACKGGHTETVSMLLQYKANVSHGETFGTCPLYVACAGGYADIVKLLWEHSTGVLQRGVFGGSYLECLEGHMYTEKLLHKNKANSRKKNYRCQSYTTRESPLYMACKGGHIETVKLLLEYNYDVTIDKRGETPLFTACAGGHTEIVKVLLDKKADISQGAKFGNWSKLHVACANGHTDIVKLLLQRTDNVGQFDGYELLLSLFIACQKGHTNIVEQLLRTNVNICESISTQKETPLYMAASRGQTNTVHLLLQNKADVTQCNIYEVSPLHVACEGGYIDIANLLLQHNANVSKCNMELESPLYVACAKGHINTVNLLLQNNADVSQCNITGMSPLHVACKGGYTDTAKCLIQNNADVSKCNKLLESPLHVACARGHTPTVSLLLHNNADVSQCNNNQVSPLHVACEGGFTDTAELLLQNNADVSKCNASGESPLYVACRGGHVNTVKLLLQKNACVSQCEKHRGRSPLHIVCDGDSLKSHLEYIYPYEKMMSEYEKKKDHIVIVQLLITGNADVNLCSKEAQTPLDIARKSKFSEVVTLIEESISLKMPQFK